MKNLLIVLLGTLFIVGCFDDKCKEGGVKGNITYNGGDNVCLVVCVDDDTDHTNGCTGGEYSTDVTGTGADQDIPYNITSVPEGTYYFRALANTEPCSNVTNPSPEYGRYYESTNGNPAGSGAPDSKNFSKTDSCEMAVNLTLLGLP